MAYVAIVSTLIFGSLFVGFTGYLQTSESLGNFDSASEEDIQGDGSVSSEAMDFDGDGLADTLEETQFGTDPRNNDTDGDGMNDGWEVEHGLNPLDNGEADPLVQDPGEADTGDATQENETDSWPDPNQGPNGDPDNDGLTNQVEQTLSTDPQRSDTDNDGLNDRWESLHTITIEVTGGNITLFDPLSGNWDCQLLTTELELALTEKFNTDDFTPTWQELGNSVGSHSCDSVLDSDSDGLSNFQEEIYGTNPLLKDSDFDLLNDIDEVSNVEINNLMIGTGDKCNEDLEFAITRDAPFMMMNASWFYLDDDGDGLLNGPSDWDTDGDGMPDGFEYCYSHLADSPSGNFSELLDPSDPTDGFDDWDNDDLNNLEEYQSDA